MGLLLRDDAPHVTDNLQTEFYTLYNGGSGKAKFLINASSKLSNFFLDGVLRENSENNNYTVT